MKRVISLIIVLILSIGVLGTAPIFAAVKVPKLKVKNISGGIELSWKKLKSKKLKIQRKESKGKYKTIKTISNKDVYTDKNVSAGKKYFYKLTYKNKSSAQKGIVRLKAPSIKSIGYDKKGMGFIWSKVKGAKKYEVYKAEVKNNKTGKYKKIKTVTSNSLDNYAETSKTTHNYKVRAVNGKSYGVYSKTKKYYYVKRKSEGMDYSYKSKYAHIYNPDVPYYGYGDPLNELYNTKNYQKTALSRNESDFKSDFSYRKFKDGVEISCAPFKKTINVPEKIDGKPVLKLGGEITTYEDNGYCYRESTWETDAEKVVISKNVQEIVSGTFSNMDHLKTIEVSKDNPYYSSENGILYNKSKTVLLFVPLKNTSATINISSKTKTTYSLFSTETEILNVPKSVTKMKGGIKNTVFNAQEGELDWIELNSINVDKDNPNYSSKDGVLYNKKKTKLFVYPYNKDSQKFTLPDSVEVIDYMILDKMQNLKTITFNKKVKKIGFERGQFLENPLTFNVYKNTYAKKWAEKSFEKGDVKIKVIK